ncbi:MAG TPA: patatin-like phospholipase family protein [Kofleriaceae bacterium]
MTASPTLAEWLAERPFALAMSSGFFAFFAHTGMLSALLDRGLAPRLVSGSSAGALVGGAWAAGLAPDALAARLETLERGDFWDPALGAGLLAGERFDRLLRALLPVTRMRDCAVPVRISVFDILRRRTVVLDDAELPRAIRASCAVPGLFHPVWIERRPYWDGGILDRPGLAGVIEADRVLFHHISARSPWRAPGAASLAIPRRAGMTTLVIDDLPRSGPFRLDAGRLALALAREATRRALETPVTDSVVRLSAA